ncbi:hypothetical protein B0H19DRAFT_1156413 [Mycena capillaripes]|nr:hypothetical protein B0H19DRAFT_1156413 [Mycena capillaripes]
MTNASSGDNWSSAEQAYDEGEAAPQVARGKRGRAAPRAGRGRREAAGQGTGGSGGGRGGGRGRGGKAPKLRVPLPNILTHSPYIRTRPGDPPSTLSNRSNAAQRKKLPVAAEQRFKAAYPFIPTYYSPVTAKQLQATANDDDELIRVVPIMRKLISEGRVISCSTRLVDPETGDNMLLYLGDRYGEEREQYENNEGLGDKTLPFLKPKNVELASARKRLVEGTQRAKRKGISVVQDGFHENLIEAYNKAVHAMAFVNPPQPDQTAMRHGLSAKEGKAVHRFPISAAVKTTLDKTDRTRVYSDTPGVGCEPGGVWHFVEGREQTGHHGQGLYMAKDMCRSSGSTTGVATFFKATETLESNVESVIKVAFPREYDGMKKVWSAGKLWERRSGCHNARALIYKLPVIPHWDGKDYGISLSFASGRFKGGYLYLPQFPLVFEYRPGTMAAFYASRTIHAVGEWEAEQMEADDETTPGRIGTVFYIPYASMEVLGTKESEWALMTNYGRFPAT